MTNARGNLNESRGGLLDLDSRSLRERFLDNHRGRVASPTLDAVGHMVLEVDRIDRVMEIGLAHLGKSTNSGRVDVGFGSARRRYFSAAAEYVQDAGERPSMMGLKLPNTQEVLQRVWRSRVPVPYDDVANNHSVAPLRDAFAAVEAKAMLAQRLEDGGQSFGIVCVDELDYGRFWTASEQEFLHDFCRNFFGPILNISRQLNAKRNTSRPSPAELEAIRMAAQGMGYKEIAVALEKSVRTIEFQLRSARQKTGASNQAELVRLCERWL